MQKKKEVEAVCCKQSTGGRLGHAYYDFMTCVIASRYLNVPFVYAGVNKGVGDIFKRLPEDLSVAQGKPVQVLNCRDHFCKKYNTPYWTGMKLSDLSVDAGAKTLCFTGSTRIDINSLPEALFQSVVNELRRRYYGERKPPALNKAESLVVAHIRRGDISNRKNSWALVPTSYYRDQLKAIVGGVGLPARVVLCTDSPKAHDVVQLQKELSQIAPTEISMRTPLQDFELMVNSNVLVVGNSSFSVIAGLLSKGAKIYHPGNVFKIQGRANHFEDVRSFLSSIKP